MDSILRNRWRALSSLHRYYIRSIVPILLLALSVTEAKAQTTYQTYDANTCYSRKLIDAKINDFAGNTKPMGFGSYDSKTDAITQPQWKTDDGSNRSLVMDYVAGLVAKACIEAADYYKDFTWSKPWFKLVENYATQVSVPTTGASLDDLNASKMYFALAELTKKGAKYEKSATYDEAIKQLKNAVKGLKAVNDDYSIRSGATVNYYSDGKKSCSLVNKSGESVSPAESGNMNAIGGWYHKATYPNQMWCDSEYMGPALLAQLVAYATNNSSAGIGTVTSSTEDDWKLIAKQFDITWNYLWNSNVKLLYHGFSATPTAIAAHTHTWATGTNGTNTAYWGRAIGWYFLALVDVLENMPNNIEDDSYIKTQDKLNSRNANIKTRLTSYLNDLAAGIWAQKKDNYLWTNVINEAVGADHDSYSTSDIQSNTKNYLEASASAIYIAAYIKAMRLGLLPSDTYKSDIETAYKNYISNFITTDNKIINTCASAGLGGGSVNIDSEQNDYKSGGPKYRNGTADYYTRGYDVTKVTNYQEGKPLGAFILASTEYERYMKADYAPSFTAANAEIPTAQTVTKGQSVTLHAAAMAKPLATYKWYSYPASSTRATTPEGTLIEGATSSDLTVKPEVNTYYYCVATNTVNNATATATTDHVLVTVSEADGIENGGSGAEESVIATFESATAPTWNANEKNGFSISGVGLKSGTSYVKMESGTKLTMTIPSGYTVTGLKINALCTSVNANSELRCNNGETNLGTVTINSGNTLGDYNCTFSNNVTGQATITITRGTKEVNINTIEVLGYSGTSTTYTITYDLNGLDGTIPDVTGATALPNSLPTPETVEGYTFGGWYTDKACTTAATPGATISDNTTLYAKWTKNKYTVTASATNGIVTITDGNSTTITSGSEVEHGTSLTFTAAANTGYEFSNWTVTGTTGTESGSTYTISSLTAATTVTANFTAKSTGGGETGNVVTKTGTFPRSDMKNFDGNPDSGKGEVSSISKDADGKTVQTGGVLTLSSESPNVQAQLNDKGTKVRLGGSFTITAASGYTIKSIELVTDQSSRNLTSSPDATPERNGTNYTYNFTKGEQSVTFINNSSGNIYVGVINVTYEFSAAEGKTPLTISFSESQKEGYVGETITLPTPTVTANGTAASSGVYNVTYKSNNTSIAEDPVDNKVTLKTEGTVAITAIVEPTTGNTDKYEGGSAVITVVSKAYTPLTVSVADVMMNSNDDAQTNPDVKVYLNNQLVASSNYTVSYEVTNGNNVTTNGSALTVKGSKGNYTAGTSTIKVTVTPTNDFASTNHCAAGTATFAYVVNEAGTKLQPEIDFPEVITLGTNVTKTLTSYVKYNGVDVTELFTKNYVITNAGSSSGASFTNAETGVFNTGTAEATVTIKITVTPLADYKDQYNGAEKTVTVNIKRLTELTITQPGNMTAKVGEVLDMPSFEITEKTSGAAVSADDLDFVINSSSTSVVTVNGDKLYAVGAGTATIIVLAKDKPGQSKYMDATTSFTVTVEDPTLHIVKNGATATNGQCITDVPGVYMTYGGWVFNSIKTFLGKDYGYKNWKDAGTDDAGAPVGFPYAVKGNGHEDSRDELGASAAPEGKTIDYQSKGFELTDKMFSVPAEGAYFVFTPKVNGTVVAHVLQNGVFDPGYNSSTQEHTPTYKPNRRVFVMDESGTRMPDAQITAHLDVTTGAPKATVTEKHTINGTEFSFTENTKIDDVRAYKTDYENASGKIYLSKDYVFDGGEGSVDGGIEGFKPTITDNKITFQNDIYKRKVNKGKDNVEGGYVVLSKAPVTYTFKVKAGKSYYLYCFGSKLSLYGYEFKADETITEDVVNLSESDSPSLSPTAEGHVAQVSLDRTFKANIWNACVLPFSLNKYQVDAIFGQTYDNKTPNGTQILYFDRVEGSKIYFVRHAYNHIVAGKPFLIKPTKDAQINTANILAFPYVTIEATGTPADFGKGTDYKWASSYAPFGVEPGDYFLRDTQVNGKPADGNMVRYPATQTGNLSVNGFRGYLKAQTEGVRKSTKSMSIVIGSVDDDETTLIENVVLDEDGTLRPALKGKVYNIQGQLMTTDASKLNTLPKGIYIINGSKITVE